MNNSIDETLALFFMGFVALRYVFPGIKHETIFFQKRSLMYGKQAKHAS